MKTNSFYDKERIIHAIRTGDSEAVEWLYVRYRAEFFRWAARRFNATRQDFEDAYQEAVIAFYAQIVSGKLQHLRHEVQVWLYAVAYRRLLNGNRKMKRILWKGRMDEAIQEELSWMAYQETQYHSDQKDRLQAAMNAMSPLCREMLVQRYYRGLSIEEIQQECEHVNVNTTSATLSRCLKRLKDIIKSARVTEA